MSASKWMVERRRDRGKTVYQVYRLRDTKQPDVPENREYKGRECPDYDTAEAYARLLNEVRT